MKAFIANACHLCETLVGTTRFVSIFVFGLAFVYASASSPTHIQAAESVFDLLPPATLIEQIYGKDMKLPRPSSDVFFAAYRAAYVKELAAKYSTSELVDIARSLAASETIDAPLLEDLYRPMTTSFGYGFQKLMTVPRDESQRGTFSTINEATQDE